MTAAAVAAALPRALAERDGRLSASVLHAMVTGKGDVASLLSKSAELHADLLVGKGPALAELTPVEEEAIADIYGVTGTTIRQHWSNVTGVESDIAGWKLRPAYALRWKRQQYVCDPGVEFRPGGFPSLSRAVQIARDVAAATDASGLVGACKGLRAKRLLDAATDEQGLVWHLGVLLAVMIHVSKLDELVRPLVDVRALDPEQSDAYARLLDVREFFATELPDAFNKGIQHFVAKWRDDDAHWLAECLVVLPSDKSSEAIATGSARLAQALAVTMRTCKNGYLQWLNAEMNIFKLVGTAGAEAELQAIVSKSPAVFFAKTAADLCTKANVAMWREERHAHLVVFDPAAERFVAVVFIYIQPIHSLDRTRDSLLVRGINPTRTANAAFTPDSIIQSILAVCREIARENGLACVALPADDQGQHWWSNREEISETLSTYVKALKVPGSALPHDARIERVDPANNLGGQDFYAYETGQGRVKTFYVLERFSN